MNDVKKDIIKAGYRITVTSWENDGDNYKTESVEGLQAPEVVFLMPLFDLFTRSGGYGNLYDPSRTQEEKFAKEVRKIISENIHLTTNEYFDGILDEDDDGLLEIFREYMYEFGLTCGEFYTRILDSIKIHYIPQDIEIQDVTSNFVNK